MGDNKNCLLCFKIIKNRPVDGNTAGENSEYNVILQSCNRLLCRDIKGSSFRWKPSNNNISPFCVKCFESSKKMWQIEEKLRQITQELESYIVSFTKEIFRSRARSHVFKKRRSENGEESDDCGEVILGIPIHQLDSESVEIESVHSDNCIPTSTTFPAFQSTNPTERKEPAVLEIFKEEPHEQVEDTYSDNGDFEDAAQDFIFPIGSPMPQEYVSEIPSANLHSKSTQQPDVLSTSNAKYVTLKKVDLCVQKQSANVLQKNTPPELRVVLQRLQFDANSKVIVPTPIVSRKRKAAVAAIASIRNKVATGKVCKINSRKTIIEEDEDSNFSGDDILGEDLDTDVDIEDKISSSKKGENCTRNIECFKCVVCSATFKFARELDSHSETLEHTNNRSFQCPQCPKNYYRKIDLRNHTKTHKYKARDCSVCGEPCATYRIYSRHTTTHNRENQQGMGFRRIFPHKRKPEEFTCVICSATFKLAKDLDKHSVIEGHVNERLFHCPLCPGKYFRKYDFKYHRTCHTFSNRECEVCGIILTSYKRYRTHMRNEHDNYKAIPKKTVDRLKKKFNLFQCSICAIEFSLAKDLDMHSEETGHVTEHSFQCADCPNQFYRQNDLKEHMRSHTYTSKNCKDCGVLLETYGKYRNHMREHAKGEFQCSFCERSYSKKEDLVQHMNTHTGATPYKCTHCEAAFSFKGALSEHAKWHMLKYMQCGICLGMFKTELSLKYHIKIHNGKSRVQCDSCPLTFYRERDHTAHMITEHGMDSPFKCEHCEMVYNFNKDLAFHVKAKHPEAYEVCKDQLKPYECEICGIAYSHLSTLCHHRRSTHNNQAAGKNLEERPKGTENKKSKGCFPCETCGQTFVQKSKLEVHVKVLHLKTLSFVCHICAKEVASQKALNTHLKIHIDNFFHECPQCGRGFKERYNLKGHIKRIHQQYKKARKSYTKTPASIPIHATTTNFQQPTITNLPGAPANVPCTGMPENVPISEITDNVRFPGTWLTLGDF